MGPRVLNILPVFAILVLAACGTAQDHCIREAQGELQTLNARIARLEADLDRGYAIHTHRDPIALRKTCPDADGRPMRCEDITFVERDEIIEIDPEALRARLSELKTARARITAEMPGKITRCRSLYPES